MTPSLRPRASPPVVAVQPPRGCGTRSGLPPSNAGRRHRQPRRWLPAVTRFLEPVVRTEQQPLPALETARSALEPLYGPVLGMDLVDATGRLTDGGTACAPGTPTISSTRFSESSTSVSERLHGLLTPFARRSETPK
jgi:hypothetical protein